MLELLESIYVIFKWFFIEIVPMLLSVPLGAIGDLLDAIDLIYILIGLLPVALGVLIRYINKS